MTFEWDENKNSENIEKHKNHRRRLLASRKKNGMKNIYNNPEQSVMESLDSAVVIEDFLPPPGELVKKTQKEKITISIDADCIRFFKIEAEKHNTKYQTMMNEVLSQYARHYAET